MNIKHFVQLCTVSYLINLHNFTTVVFLCTPRQILSPHPSILRSDLYSSTLHSRAMCPVRRINGKISEEIKMLPIAFHRSDYFLKTAVYTYFSTFVTFDTSTVLSYVHGRRALASHVTVTLSRYKIEQVI